MKRTPIKRYTGLKRSSKPLKRSYIKHTSYVALRGKSKVKRHKKGEITKLKEKLWQLCRTIIIKRHGNTCYCCGATNLVGSNLHIGHFIPSSICSLELRYSLDNLRPCCYRCNVHLSGNWVAYEVHLKRDGVDVEELKKRNQETKGLQYGASYIKMKIDEYTRLLSNI